MGRRVAQRKLDDLRAYTDQLPAPAAPDDLDADQVAAGRALFTTGREDGGAGCVACHTADPNQPVSAEVVPIETLYPAYNDELLVLSPAPVCLYSTYCAVKAVSVSQISLAGACRGFSAIRVQPRSTDSH